MQSESALVDERFAPAGALGASVQPACVVAERSAGAGGGATGPGSGASLEIAGAEPVRPGSRVASGSQPSWPSVQIRVWPLISPEFRRATRSASVTGPTR